MVAPPGREKRDGAVSAHGSHVMGWRVTGHRSQVVTGLRPELRGCLVQGLGISTSSEHPTLLMSQGTLAGPGPREEAAGTGGCLVSSCSLMAMLFIPSDEMLTGNPSLIPKPRKSSERQFILYSLTPDPSSCCSPVPPRCPTPTRCAMGALRPAGRAWQLHAPPGTWCLRSAPPCHPEEALTSKKQL